MILFFGHYRLIKTQLSIIIHVCHILKKKIPPNLTYWTFKQKETTFSDPSCPDNFHIVPNSDCRSLKLASIELKCISYNVVVLERYTRYVWRVSIVLRQAFSNTES